MDGTQLVRGEVVVRARAEADHATRSAAESLDRAGPLFGPLTRAELRSVRAQTLRLGRPVLGVSTSVPALRFGRREIPPQLLAGITENMGGAATVYAAAHDAFIPVATSLKKADGAPALDAILPAQSEMSSALRAGRAVAGPVEAAGEGHFASLEPIIGPGGRVIGAWGASYPLSGLDAAARAFATSPMFSHGMLAVLDRAGAPLVRSRRLAPGALETILTGLPRAGSSYRLLGEANAESGLRVVAVVYEPDLTLQAILLDSASLSILGVVVVLALCLAWLGARRLTSALTLAERSRTEAEAAKSTAESASAALHLELDRAAHYVASLLPKASRDGPVTSDWVYAPSAGVGGDAFGYHWLDERRFAFYLLDVCGHGVGAALLATTVMNLLRSGRVEGADLTSPGSVLSALNAAFPMSAQNGMYFTMWYGVYDAPRREIAYAAAGHHPAVLVAPDAGPQLLRGKGLPIGCFDQVLYPEGRAAVSPGARLYVFSDGIFEVQNKSTHDMFSFQDFVNVIMQWQTRREGRELTYVVEAIQDVQGKAAFDDDCALLEFEFSREQAALEAA
jgi:serine phosphatase RsbU (regulator of sigma subunit)